MPAHCDNDVVDADETSIDCGGECGCRAEFIALGDLPGGTFNSTAHSVSRSGDVVVGVGTTDDEATHSFIWKSSVLSKIPLQIPGLRQDYAYAVSDDGSVVVGGAGVENSAGMGWVWIAGGATITNAQVSTLVALSGDGKVAAGDHFTESVRSSPLTFTVSTSVIRLLSTLPAHDTNSYPTGASLDGRVIVGRCGSTRVEAVPCRWDAAGVPTIVGDLPGGDSYGWASDVSDDGIVVVGNSSSSSGTQAFHYNGTRTYGLGFLPGGTHSMANGVSGDGRFVVGTASSSDDHGAFLWDEASGMRSVADELKSRGYELPNTWKVRNANGISGDGKSIVGAATNPSGNNEAFLVRLK
ncbi:MAG TPA: hypothetical protein VKP30_32820 [Polyangiaceae bacterium]|nr:hypothetical protein [Polyangiaceae bacterium]